MSMSCHQNEQNHNLMRADKSLTNVTNQNCVFVEIRAD